MTFEEFQATRVHGDLRPLLEAQGDEPYGDKEQTGFIYDGTLHIEDVMMWWPAQARREGRYHLLLGNQEWISNNLEELERELYDWGASDAGLYDAAPDRVDTAGWVIADQRLWVGSQALQGSLIAHIGLSLYRARIKRDAYDNQCDASVDVWCQGRGWSQVQWVPIKDLPIRTCSYQAKPDKWMNPMMESLRQLIALGHVILTGGR